MLKNCIVCYQPELKFTNSQIIISILGILNRNIIKDILIISIKPISNSRQSLMLSIGIIS